MRRLKEYLNGLPIILDEDLHPEIKSALDSKVPAAYKHKQVGSAIRKALKNGESSGLQDSKPKKGSSRAVYFPQDKHKIHVDGHPTEAASVYKVAFPGQLDKYNKSGHLLGEHQNHAESDHYTNKRYGMLSHDSEKGDQHYKTNHEHGVLAPVFHAHEDGHYVHMGRVDRVSAGDFRKHTKTPDHPKGISHQEFYDAVNSHYHAAHGKDHMSVTPKARVAKVQEHPLVEKFQQFVADTGHHPGDLGRGNMGVWTHPQHGTKHIVASDFGFSQDVAKHYDRARVAMRQQKYGWK